MTAATLAPRYDPDTPLPFESAQPLRTGSLFSGYGGLDLAVHAVLGGETAWVSDIDPGACKILAHRYPGVPNLGDITRINWTHVIPVDVITAGFPCQDVSGSGKRAGLRHGTRSGLWHEVVRAIAALRPGLVVLENVRGLLSARGDEPTAEHLAAEQTRDACTNLLAWVDARRTWALRQGRTEDVARLTSRRAHLLGLRKRAVARARRHERRLVRALGTVLGSLADLGYDAVWHGLRAADVGAPHGRFRIFILAWPAADAERGRLSGWAPLQVGQPVERVASAGGGEGARLPTPTARDWRGHNQRGDTTCLTGALLPTPAVNDMGEGKTVEHWDAWTEKMKAAHGNGNGHGASLVIEAQRLLPTPTSMDSHASGGGYNGQTNVTLTDATARQPEQWGKYAAAVNRWEHVTRPAPAPTEPSSTGTPRLSPRFSEWLMGVPDGWITDVPDITRNEALKACGNGVVPQQAEAALRRLLPLVMELAA